MAYESLLRRVITAEEQVGGFRAMQLRRLSRYLMPTPSFFIQRRLYYEKVREERESSDSGVGDMFDEFPRNPDASRVPKEFRTTTTEAVRDAERLNFCFLVLLVVGLPTLFFGGFLDPFLGQYKRPEGYGQHCRTVLGDNGEKF
ncbi:hypothetical protein ERJ75_000256500 [Trypanosoma vivax]|uniref:Transmembrane protein n=1 Tax=Trypanosoma vivax (strain Y486) TaxID=1055687 RepID=G0U205_TRYVY|nr:hypothetical protein TRVL_04748 [Trypanosoma vivax]KAH8618752.1 hypothetical protein ERJ75_000256500 [Trypanosoma vivax]CCC50307.1 conserved hypothetical protein [Trypanosoma vivax Y486]